MMDERRRLPNSTLRYPKEPMRRNVCLGRNAERRAREFARAYHSIERVLFVKHAGVCCVPGCGRQPRNAHVVGGGVARKASYILIARLCFQHDDARGRPDSFHNLGSAEAFRKAHGVDLWEAAALLELDWLHRGEVWLAEVKEDGRWEAWTRSVPAWMGGAA